MFKLDEIRPAIAALVTHGALLGKLAHVEWAAEKLRLTRLFALSLLAVVLLVVLLLSISIVAIALAWDTPYRLAVALGLIALYAVGLAVALGRLSRLVSSRATAFVGTREELTADFAILKRKFLQ
jgi:uncharacterized membrane protein YqjE